VQDDTTFDLCLFHRIGWMMFFHGVGPGIVMPECWMDGRLDGLCKQKLVDNTTHVRSLLPRTRVDASIFLGIMMFGW